MNTAGNNEVYGSVSERPNASGRRRKHKNSKNGCPNCKKRRVKCAEDLPACLNCVKHKVRCGYLDYTAEQIAELKRSKAMWDKSDLGDSLETKLHIGSSRHSSIKSLGLSEGRSRVDSETSFKLVGKDSPSYFTSPSQSVVTKEFNDLLSPSQAGRSIIYPVYSVSMNNESISSGITNDTSFNSSSGSQFPLNSLLDGGIQRPSSQPGNQIHEGQGPYCGFKPTIVPTDYENSLALPGGMPTRVVFKPLKRIIMKPDTILSRLTERYARDIITGTCSLDDIKNLYNCVLNYFIRIAYERPLMLNALLYFGFNFVSLYLQFEQSSKNYINVVDITGDQKTYFLNSIKYYALVIRDLRKFLNQGVEAFLCTSVSYLLSLTSTYDTSATYESAGCFRDGIFSVMSHCMAVAKEQKKDIMGATPVYMRLMANVERCVYFPPYNPLVLIELRSCIQNFNEILYSMFSEEDLKHLLEKDIDCIIMVEKLSKDLLDFVQDTIINYEPLLNLVNTKMDLQEQTLFLMLHRWISMCPAKVALIAFHTDPTQKVLHFLFRATSKILLALFPQVKFFFLRDFDSPLMLDVYSSSKDVHQLQYEIANPSRTYFTREMYDAHKDELGSLAGQMMRIVTFFQKRLNFIYRETVYKSHDSFEIYDIKEWRKTIKSVSEAREIFLRATNFHEHNIVSFSTTYIKQHHYPLTEPIGYSINDESVHIPDRGFLNLSINGLLKEDFDSGY